MTGSKSELQKVTVNRIIPFSSVDGPGNRSVVFLQGCGFNCRYCHNPETRGMCNNCGICVQKCKTHALSLADGKVVFEPDKCVKCDMCIKSCPNGSSPRTSMMDAEDVMKVVLRQVPYIRGITVSGGECTTYPEFLKQLCRLSNENMLPVLLDSNGSYDFSKDEELMDLCDGVMLDIKAWNSDEHKFVTGTDNDIVLKNLIFLAENNKLEEVRTVVAPDIFNATETVIETSKALLPYLDKKDIRYKIIAYRPMGVRSQYKTMTTPTKEMLLELEKKANDIGIKNTIII